MHSLGLIVENFGKITHFDFFLIFHKYSLAILDARLTRKVGSVLQCIFSQDRILGSVDVSLMSRTLKKQIVLIHFTRISDKNIGDIESFQC